MLKIAVCDDNLSVIRIIKSSIIDCFQSHKVDCDVDTYSNFEDLEKKLSDEPYDLLFLDIKTPTVDGVEFAEKVRENNSDITIIFISSKEERVFDTFKAKPFAFVRKSNFLTDITDVIDRFLLTAKEKSEDHKLSVISHGVRFTESIKDIVYIEGKGIYQNVHFAQKERKPLEISSRMEALEEQLSPHGFLRIHKGYLVNFSFISAIDNDNTLKLRSGEVLPISRRKTAEVRKQFLALCDKNGVLLF